MQCSFRYSFSLCFFFHFNFSFINYSSNSFDQAIVSVVKKKTMITQTSHKFSHSCSLLLSIWLSLFVFFNIAPIVFIKQCQLKRMQLSAGHGFSLSLFFFYLYLSLFKWNNSVFWEKPCDDQLFTLILSTFTFLYLYILS